MSWKKGQKVSHAGYKGIITKVFTDGSAVVNYAPDQIDKHTGKPKTGILTNLPSAKTLQKPIVNTPETFIDFEDTNIDEIFIQANRKNATEYVDSIMGGIQGTYEHQTDGEIIVGKYGMVKILPTDFEIIETNSMNKKTFPPHINLDLIEGTPLYWRWNDITVENRIIVSELEIFTDTGACVKVTENNPKGVYSQYS